MAGSRSERVPALMQPIYSAIVAMTDAFCQDHLNDEYAARARQLAAALSPKTSFAAWTREVGNLGLRHRIFPGQRQLPLR